MTLTDYLTSRIAEEKAKLAVIISKQSEAVITELTRQLEQAKEREKEATDNDLTKEKYVPGLADHTHVLNPGSDRCTICGERYVHLPKI